jgi:hypothetical protein
MEMKQEKRSPHFWGLLIHYQVIRCWLLRFDNAINGTNFHALASVKIAFTLYALIWINDINIIALGNCFYGAFWLTCAARNAFLCDFHCHNLLPP